MKLKVSKELPFDKNYRQKMPQSKGVLFSWKLETDAPAQAEVLLYRAADIFDDRFQRIEDGEDVENFMIIKLGLAQQWMYSCKEDCNINAAHCQEASMIKRVLLKQGTYIYLYRINGALKVNLNDNVTKLATKREVNYIDVRQDDEELSYQDVCEQNCSKANSRQNCYTDHVNGKTELLKAYAAVKDMYNVNMAVNRVSPLEKAIWNRVEKEMATRLHLSNE